ncbi:MAG: AraC family transcriptional regulator [Pseudomonadota bacterium]
MSAHFAPLGLATLALVFPHARADGHLGLAHPRLGSAVATLVFLKFASFAIYGAASVHVLRVRLGEAKRRERPRLRRMLSWLSVVLLAAAVSYGALFAQMLGFAPMGDADTLGALVSVGVIFFFGYYVLSHPDSLNRPPPSPPPAPAHARETRQVIELLATHRPFLDSTFTLQAFAQQTGLAPDMIRRVIEAEYQMEVGEQITSQRLAAFRTLAQKPSLAHRSTLDLALEAGFPSKATFYRAFAAAHDSSPSACRKSVLSGTGDTSQDAR